MNNLEAVVFENEETAAPVIEKPIKENPTIDFFNSAGNTKLENDPIEETKEETATDPNKPKGKITLGKVISGKSAVTLVNIFIPSFIVFALGKLGYEANKGQLKLTNEEKDILNPVVQDCLDYIEINFDNPFYALAFVASMIYGSKIFDIVPDLKKIKADIVTEDKDIEEKPAYMNYKPRPKEEKPPMTIRNDSPLMDSNKYREIRERHDSTTIRSDKKRIIITAIEETAPKDLIEAFKIYGAIFPQRDENYFRKWYYDNIEMMPASLRFDVSGSIEENEAKEFDL